MGKFVLKCHKCKEKFEADNFQIFYCDNCQEAEFTLPILEPKKSRPFIDKLKKFFDKYGGYYDEF